MRVSLKQISGIWDSGWVLDKHSVYSTYTGDNAQGYPQFSTTRTEVGEATFLLKYRNQWNRAGLLAQTLAENICPKVSNIGFILPMPASIPRMQQPVTLVANELGKLIGTPVFNNILLKTPNVRALKGLNTKQEKLEAIGDSFYINDAITNEGRWNVLVIDDLFHTGASMEMACKALRTYHKVGKIYVAALTWR